eukprot:366147-Chlamydomonas_euryale.AAC.4
MASHRSGRLKDGRPHRQHGQPELGNGLIGACLSNRPAKTIPSTPRALTFPTFLKTFPRDLQCSRPPAWAACASCPCQTYPKRAASRAGSRAAASRPSSSRGPPATASAASSHAAAQSMHRSPCLTSRCGTGPTASGQSRACCQTNACPAGCALSVGPWIAAPAGGAARGGSFMPFCPVLATQVAHCHCSRALHAWVVASCA